jgi:acetyl-CoA synthetase/medium-chain acyl-CoA synthetase
MRDALVDGLWNVPPRFNFTRDVIEAIATEDANRRALAVVDDVGVVRHFTYGELAILSAQWSNLLSDVGLERGDRMLVMIGKRPEWHAVMLAALRLGAIAIPCSDMLRAKDLRFRSEHSRAKLLIAEREAQPEIDGMLAAIADPPVVVYLDNAIDHLHTYRPRAPFADTRAEEPALILYTSGTTADPRGAVHAHAYTFAKRLQAEHWLDARPGDLVWCSAATGWAKAIWNVLLGPWSCGAEVVMHGGAFDPEERFDLIERLGITILCQAPTEYRLMAKLDDLERFDLSRLRHAVAAGEPLNPEVIRVFRDAFGVTIYDGYGQTENTLLVANTPSMLVRPGSMGMPTPGHEVDILDENGGRAAPGVEGDIALYGRPPTLFAGYWEDPEATRAAFNGDWYVTGDRGVRDKDGYFWFTGRSDDVILSAAYRIGPFEVESALLEHEAVAESAVVGKPDPDRGQIVKAFVVLRPEYEPSNELAGALQEHCRAVTAPYKYPREIEFIDSLPKTRSGKIRRVELRELEQRRAAAPSMISYTEPPSRPAPALEPPEPEPEPEPYATIEQDGEDARPVLRVVEEADEEDLPATDAPAAEPPEEREAISLADLWADSAPAVDEDARATDEARRREREEAARAEAEARARVLEEARLRAEADARRAEEVRARAEEQTRGFDDERRRHEEAQRRPEEWRTAAPSRGEASESANESFVSRLRAYTHEAPPHPPAEPERNGDESDEEPPDRD